MKKAKRSREKNLLIPVTEEERKKILLKMRQAKAKNISTFVRETVIDGEIKIVDYSSISNDLKNFSDYIVGLNKIGNNINQVAKKVNETDEVSQKDIKELSFLVKSIQENFEEINNQFLIFLKKDLY